MLTLNIIQAEHRSMWRVAAAMSALAADLPTQAPAQAKDALQAIRLMLQYIDSFADRFHHPKEDDFLFRKLWERSTEARAQITLLQQQHEDGPRYRERLQTSLAQASERGASTAALQDGILQFCRHLQEHIRIEETSVMPMARAALLPEDWQEIDAAFANNQDPLFGEQAMSDMLALRRRIVQLAPAPVGLGGSDDTDDMPAPAHPAIPPARAAASGSLLMEVSGLTSHYGRIQALHGIDLQVREGQLVALVGANGAGKTTLLRTISGVQPASGGTIRFGGSDITRLRADLRVRQGICQVPEGRRVFGPLSIEDNIRLGAYTRPKPEVESSLARMFELFPILKEKRALPAGTLSGGQQQMLAMARALMGRPTLLLLDEPSMGLAPLLVDEIFRVVKELKSQGITIVLVEQNAHAALAIADFGYVLETGNVLLSGPGPELLQNEQVKKAYLGI